jgi:hypothetical protein
MYLTDMDLTHNSGLAEALWLLNGACLTVPIF